MNNAYVLKNGRFEDIAFYGTAGGIVPSPDEVAGRIRRLLAASGAAP